MPFVFIGVLGIRISGIAITYVFFIVLCFLADLYIVVKLPAPMRYVLAELLGKRDDDVLRAADVTEPVHVLVLSNFADDLSAMGKQAREDVIEIVNGEHDAPYAKRVHRCVLRLSLDHRRRIELVELKPTVAVRGPQHCDLALNVLKPNDKVQPTSLDLRLALNSMIKSSHTTPCGWIQSICGIAGGQRLLLIPLHFTPQ
jgi:hypothetical protein